MVDSSDARLSILSVPRVAARLDFSHLSMQFISEVIGGLHAPLGEKADVAFLAFEQCQEHADCILQLLSDARFGSALALLRPCFESLVRGIWLWRICTDAQFEAFITGKESLKTEALLKHINLASPRKRDAFLKNTWDQSEKTLHRFTHVSFQLLIRGHADSMADPDALVDDIHDSATFATGTALLAAMEVAHAAKSRRVLTRIGERLSLLYPV